MLAITCITHTTTTTSSGTWPVGAHGGLSRAGPIGNASLNCTVPSLIACGRRHRGATVTDWKKIAGDAWCAPDWKVAAVEYAKAHRDRPFIVEIEPHRLKRLQQRLIPAGVTFEQAYREINEPLNRPIPQVTVETIILTVRKRGLAALKDPANLERLERCDAAAKAEINRRIEKLGLESCGIT